MSPAPFDGNVTAGDLADVFAFDADNGDDELRHLPTPHPIATLHAYLRAPGMVLRCASCDAVQLRIVDAPHRTWLDLRGIDMLTIPDRVTIDSMPDAAASPP